MIVYGPVPSRRLGRSLGINNIPHKVCGYSCVYCQVGRTRRLQLERAAYHDPAQIARQVGERMAQARQAGTAIDYLSFVPDGEPTLDINLGAAIELLRPLGGKIAVITNGTLLGREDVRADLVRADWVSVKVDSVVEASWRRINRPHRRLKLATLLEGMLEFRRGYGGRLVTETMLVRDLNDGDDDLEELAEYLARLRPAVAYLSIPTRPPAEEWVRCPREESLAGAHLRLAGRLPRVEQLIDYEGNAFASTGDPAADILSIAAVHPLREEAVQELLRQARADWPVVRALIDGGLLIETDYQGRRYFVRRFPRGRQ